MIQLNVVRITTENLLKGLIALMRIENVAPTRTRLVKYLYLIDLDHARRHEGRTLTGWGWYVGHYGPLANEALALMDRGAEEGWLIPWSSDDGDNSSPERRAVSYGVEKSTPPLPAGFGPLRRWIKEYGDSTPRLLRFVYGHTEPMKLAHSGERLDFTRARSVSTSPSALDVALTAKQRKRMDDLMSRLRNRYAEVRRAVSDTGGPFDQVYWDGVPKDELFPECELTVSFGDSEDRE